MNKTTPLQRIARALMTGIAIAIPTMMFLPNFIVAYDNANLDTGDRVHIGTTRYGGGAFIVDAIENGTVTATNLETAITVSVPREQITIMP